MGDAHLTNFGVFGTPERKFLFDINDFDETHPGPWEWDLKRLAASVVVAARDCFSTPERCAMVASTVREHRMTMRSFAEAPNVEVWRSHLEVRTLRPRCGVSSARNGSYSSKRTSPKREPRTACAPSRS